jgi:hypothetical protein
VSDSGSAPIETVALLTLLLLPVGPAVLLYDQISNQLAAESIARHAIRAAVLDAPLGQVNDPGFAISALASSWQKRVGGYRVIQSGELVTLEVEVSGAKAIATIGREPQR